MFPGQYLVKTHSYIFNILPLKFKLTQIGHDECVVYKQLYIYKELCN